MGYNKKKAKKEIEMQRITSKDNELIKHIKKLKDKGLSIRQISRLTGVSKGMVERIR